MKPTADVTVLTGCIGAQATRGESVTGFVLHAATRAAEEELAFERETLVPADFFDALLSSLDAPDQVPGELEALGCKPRSFERA